MSVTLEQVSHDHGIDLEKLVTEFDPKLIIEREQAAGIQFGPFHRQYLIDKGAPEQVRRMLKKAALRPYLVATQQTFMEAGAAPTANLRAPIATTTVENNLYDPSIHAPINAGDMRAHKSYSVEFGGVMGTTGTPTIAWRARCGTDNSTPPTGTDLGISPTVTLGTFTAQPFYGWFTMVVRTIGVAASTATVTGNGFVVMPAAAAATVTPHAVFGGAIPTTVNQAVAQGLGVSIAWGTSNAANTLTPQWVTPIYKS